MSDDKVIGRPFEKGKSGNPGGRPKGLAKAARDHLDSVTGEKGSGADLLVKFWSRVMADPDEPTSLRLKASQYLAERGWGKAAMHAMVEDEDPLDLADREAADIVEQFDRRLDEVAAKRSERQSA